MEAAEFGDLLEGERGIVDQPGGGRMRHERLSHVSVSTNNKGRPFPERPQHAPDLGEARRERKKNAALPP
jgi:hypothetical protein